MCFFSEIDNGKEIDNQLHLYKGTLQITEVSHTGYWSSYVVVLATGDLKSQFHRVGVLS